MSKSTAITIGNFDGVHRGHVELVRKSRESVGAAGRVVVMCFDPSPLTILRPGSEPPRLSTFEQRCRWLIQAGADAVEKLVPNPELLGRSADEFIKHLVERFSPAAIVEGPDFHFGRGRQGTIQTLRAAGEQLGFEIIEIKPLEAILADHAIVRISSTMTRWLVQRGRVRDAARMLGRPYELESTVVQGDQRGRTIGIPTVNLAHNGQLLPADGIYAGRASIVRDGDGETYPAAISVGTKPTFGGRQTTCEAHLIGYDGPLDDYGWTIRLEFHEWLRDQVAYAGVDALVDQIHRDIAATIEITAADRASSRTLATQSA